MVRLEVDLIIESFHDFEEAKRFGSLSDEYAKESATIYISPEDASSIGVNDGDVVEVYSKHGSVKVRARIKSEIKKGLAFMPPSPHAMALTRPGEQLSPIKVGISKSMGEPTSLLKLFTS